MCNVVVNRNMPVKPVKDDVGRFLIDAEFTYEDFAKQSSGSGFATLRVHDYSWEEHGYSLANELYSEIAELLEDKFQMTQNLTYFTCVECSLQLVLCVTTRNILCVMVTCISCLKINSIWINYKVAFAFDSAFSYPCPAPHPSTTDARCCQVCCSEYRRCAS